ncbi:M56 family metallopeptidase [Kineothrix sedimenti]|uniref:M56 family metallopeptidase n=1 Tax=Kineothrix sedimenti TaxID=3123317 RepID=A0ABZ3EXX2_9FIRM
MIITLSTVLNIVFFSGIATLSLNYIITKSEIVLKIGIQIVLFIIVMIMFRLFLPFELPSQNNINITKFWPDIYITFVKPVFAFAEMEWSLLSIMIIISIIGSIIFVLKLILSYIALKHTVNNFKIINKSAVNRVVDKINSKYKKQVCFNVVSSSQVKSPFIFGLLNPIIILPEIELSVDEWYYILSHEMAHYYFKDLWIRFICELLQAIYWWNPFVYLLRNQLIKIQELRVDSVVINKLEEFQKMEYLECLIRIARLQSDIHRMHWVAAFNSDCEDDIANRIEAIFEYAKGSEIKNKRTIKYMLIGLVLVLIIFLMPNFIIFEPYAITDEHAEGTYEINETNSYLIQNDDGTYDVYVEQEYVGTVTEIFDENLIIYNE